MFRLFRGLEQFSTKCVFWKLVSESHGYLRNTQTLELYPLPTEIEFFLYGMFEKHWLQVWPWNALKNPTTIIPK